MHWPQITYIVLIAINITINAAYHGQPRRGKYSFWIALISSFLAIALLNAGGFFNENV